MIWDIVVRCCWQLFVPLLVSAVVVVVAHNMMCQSDAHSCHRSRCRPPRRCCQSHRPAAAAAAAADQRMKNSY